LFEKWISVAEEKVAKVVRAERVARAERPLLPRERLRLVLLELVFNSQLVVFIVS
jgi:hypothetical protein